MSTVTKTYGTRAKKNTNNNNSTNSNETTEKIDEAPCMFGDWMAKKFLGLKQKHANKSDSRDNLRTRAKKIVTILMVIWRLEV